MTARTLAKDRDKHLLDILSRGRLGSPRRMSFTVNEVAQIARTVRRVPEVMVKVTGGGKTSGAVRAHLAYVSRRGGLEIETNDGERIRGDQHQALLDSWDLGVVAGQYRRRVPGQAEVRTSRLVHNIVLGMPSPTPPDKVLKAARLFARKEFTMHHYAMVLHTDQRHPHVHLVVRAEDDLGRRLHIDKIQLPEWRQDFAEILRAQGVAANATSRYVRGQTKKGRRDSTYRSLRHRRSVKYPAQVKSIANELSVTGAIRDPARPKLVATRRQLLADWETVAQMLAAQGEVALAGEVRAFATRLPAVRTDRERLAESFLRFVQAQQSTKQPEPRERLRERTVYRSRDDEFTR